MSQHESGVREGAVDASFQDEALRELGGGPGQSLRFRHPPGLYLLFATEMWERFSYYGMRAFLIYFMTFSIASGGLGWTEKTAGTAYGWYTGLVYLAPVLGGYIADKFIGTHWSMLIGGLIISAGHFVLAFADYQNLWAFLGGLSLVIIGTGFFKPCVSVMVGQLYPREDPRRDAAYTIFYMGINVGAFLGPIICGGLRMGMKEGEVFGWHWAFGAAGVGMVLGLIAYLIGRPFVLQGIGAAPLGDERGDPRSLVLGGVATLVLAGIGTALYLTNNHQWAVTAWDWLWSGENGAQYVAAGIALVALLAIVRFIFAQKRDDRGPVAAIFIMSFFVIFFWMAFEQAGSSLNLFAKARTDRGLSPETASLIYRVLTEKGYPIPWWVGAVIGAGLIGVWLALREKLHHAATFPRLAMNILGLAIGPTLLIASALKPGGALRNFLIPDDEQAFLTSGEYPPDWFQSANSFFILCLAPLFAALWLRLGRKGREPSSPVKFGVGLILVGLGFVFMVQGARLSEAGGDIRLVSGWWLMAAYFVHTVAELWISPVGLSLVNRLSPPRFVSLLMGVWFLAVAVASLTGGMIAGRIKDVAEGKYYTVFGGQADFFLLFVMAPIAAGVLLLAISPLVSRLMRRPQAA
ncbi:MAG: peptide MFS transporter [Phycisphaerales bacterium]|nr:peptide MFS transporter [Phycisphaerales bacterium]